MASARKNLCAALKIDCFAPKPVPEKEEAPDLEAGGDEELDYKQETTTPVAEPRPPASLRRSPSDEPYLEPRDDDDAPNALVKVARSSTALPAVWKSKFYGSFVLNRRVVLHAIDATPARWRGGAGSSPLDGASTAASSPRYGLVKNYRAHPTYWLISTQTTTSARAASFLRSSRAAAASNCGPAASTILATFHSDKYSPSSLTTRATRRPR